MMTAQLRRLFDLRGVDSTVIDRTSQSGMNDAGVKELANVKLRFP